jgi:guanylate kinase
MSFTKPGDDLYLGGRPKSIFYVLSGPGGTGKSTLIQRWRRDDPSLGYVRNYTTRAQRPPDAASGIDDADWFHFVSPSEFQKLVREDQLVQWSHAVKGYLSGTPIAPLHEAVAAGRDLVFDYTPQLYMNLRTQFREHVVGIFIVPPSINELASRLRGRGSENEQRFQLKMAMGRQDLAYAMEHDYLVVNADLERTLATLKGIRLAEQAKMANLEGVADTYRSLGTRPMLFYYDPLGQRIDDICEGH